MKIKKGFVLRVVGGENVVVPVGEMSKSFHGMINLNETGAFLWRFFSEEHTDGRRCSLTDSQYNSPQEIAHRGSDI